MKVIILDNDIQCVSQLQSLLNKRADIKHVGNYSDPLQAIIFLNSNFVDLIFVEINLLNKPLNEFWKRINPETNVVITSNSKDFAAEAFELNVLDYIIKPITKERVLKTLAKLHAEKPKVKPASLGVLFVKLNNQILRIRKDDIFYIQADGDYIEIHTSNNKYLMNLSMRMVEEVLGTKSFARIHRSFIVSIEKIERIVDNKVHIKNEKIPIGSAYKNKFLALLNVL